MSNAVLEPPVTDHRPAAASGTVRRAGRAAGGLAAAMFVLVAVPAALIAISRLRFGSANPLTGMHPSTWDLAALIDTVGAPLSDATLLNAMVRSALVIGWLALAALVIATGAETMHLVRHRGIERRPTFGFGWCQPIARTIAAGILAVLPPQFVSAAGTASAGVVDAVASLHAHDPSTTFDDGYRVADPQQRSHQQAAPGPEISPATERTDTRSAATTVDLRGQEDGGAATYVVQRGDSIYSIAQRLAGGDPARTARFANAILDANLGRAMHDGSTFSTPALILPGWQLTIPAGVPQPTWATSTPTVAGPDDSILAPVDPPTSVPSERTIVHTVVVGDTLAAIAERHLGDATRWTELWELNRGREMDPGAHFEDPNLILPAWELLVPVEHQAEPPAVAAPSDTPPSEVPPADAAPAEIPPSEVSPADAAPSDTAPSDTAPSDAAPTTSGTVAPDSSLSEGQPAQTPVATSPGGSQPVAAPSDAGEQRDAGADAPTLRVEHAAMLATALVGLAAARRRAALRRSTTRTSARVPDPTSTSLERRLGPLADAERMARVDLAARSIARQLTESDSRLGLLLVQADGRITCTLTAPAEATLPWRATSDPTQWTLSPSTSLETLVESAGGAGAPSPTLVQIGRADGAAVMIDLEAAGHLSIDAAPATADDIARAVTTGLATNPYAETVELVTVGLGDDVLFGHPNGQRVRTVDEALDLVERLAEAPSADDGDRTARSSTFRLRALRAHGRTWTPCVLVLTHHDIATASADARRRLHVGPGSAIAVVAADHSEAAGDAVRPEHAAVLVPPRPANTSSIADHATEELHDDDVCTGATTWRLDAFGQSLDIEPVGITQEQIGELSAWLDDVDRTDEAEATNGTNTDASTDTDSRTDTDANTSADTNADANTNAGANAVVASQVANASAGAARTDPIVVERDEPAMTVRLFGAVDVVDRAGSTVSFSRGKALELVAWAATHREHPLRSRARAALWDADVRDATFANVVSDARRSLLRHAGDQADWIARHESDRLVLDSLIATDADLIRVAGQRADQLVAAGDSNGAIAELRQAVERLRGAPFAGTDYLWPDAEGITTNLVLLATGTTARLAEIARELGDVDTVFWATSRGLDILPGHEELIALRMRAHADAGDITAVRREWETYERSLATDPWSCGEPAPKLARLRHELMTR